MTNTLKKADIKKKTKIYVETLTKSAFRDRARVEDNVFDAFSRYFDTHYHWIDKCIIDSHIVGFKFNAPFDLSVCFYTDKAIKSKDGSKGIFDFSPPPFKKMSIHNFIYAHCNPLGLEILEMSTFMSI